MRGLVMGRFQPFHLGHLDLVRQVLSECDEVIIAVTSSQFNYLQKDPFTAGERIEMIRGAVGDSGLGLERCIILAIENQFNVATWSAYLKASLPAFDRIYSGNDYVSMLLEGSGYVVVRPVLLDRRRYAATRIREMITSDDGWEKTVPAAVARVIREADGVRRLRVLANTDTNPTEH